MAEPQTQSPDNPYVGPRTFEERDAKQFFGREREARDLLSLIISEPLVLFFAESGAGKSSLLNAKVIPSLRDEGFFVYPVARVGGELPVGVEQVDNIYVFNLMASLAAQTADHAALANTTLLDFMTARKGELDDSDIPRVLIIDQFEELLTTHPQRWEDREKFFRQLRQLVRKDPLLWIVLTMREDYIGSLDPYETIVPGKLRARYYMQRMEPPAAIKAIQQPAAHAGRAFAKGVAGQLVDNLRQIRTGPDQTVAGQYVEPVQLQVVCYQLWENLRGTEKSEITAEDVEKLGNVDEALAEFYESALSDVVAKTDVSEFNLRNWFERHLITEAATRGTVYQGSEDTAGMANSIVALLERKFLLRAEIRAGATWFELIHDRFISPILRANQRWRLTQSPLMRAAEEWDRNDDPALLYRDERLAAALTNKGPEMSEPVVEAFLEASEQAQNQREFERVQKEAEADRQIARRLRGLALALGIFVVAAVVATYFAVTLANRAFTESAVAQEAQVAAEGKATEAFVMQTTAEANSAQAIEEQTAALAAADEAATRAAALQEDAEAAAVVAAGAQATAESASQAAELANQEAAAAQSSFDATRSAIDDLRQAIQGQLLIAQIPQLLEETNDTELALLFGVQAYRLNQLLGRMDEDVLIYQSLRETLARPFFNTTLLQNAPTTALLTLPASQVIVSGLENGQLQVWNLNESGAPLQVDSNNGAVSSLALHSSGEYLVSGHQSGQIILWEISRGAEGVVRGLTELSQWDGHNGAVTSLAFNQDSSQLASGGEDSVLLIWDSSTPAEEIPLSFSVTDANINPQFSFHEGSIFGVGFRPNGQLVSGSENVIILWNMRSSGPAAAYFLDQPTPELPFRTGFSLSSDGDFVAVPLTNNDFSVYWIPGLLNGGTASRVPFQREPDHIGPTARTVVFQSGTRQLAVYGSDRLVNIYNVNSIQVSNPQITLAGSSRTVRALAFLNFEDDLRLIAGGSGDTLRLWQVNTNDPAAELPQDIANLEEVIAIACQTVQRNMTQNEWDQFIPGEPYQATCPNLEPHFSVGDAP